MSILRLLALAGLLTASAAARQLAPGLNGVALGMTKDDLLAARPALRKKNYSGFERPTLSLDEDLGPAAAPYRHARYELAKGRLVAVFLSGYPKGQEAPAVRAKAIAAAKALWGDGYWIELVEDGNSVLNLSPVLVWHAADREIRLTVPADVKKRSGAVVSLDVRLASAKHARESELAVTTAKRAMVLAQCGVEDRVPPGADLGADELLAAPESVTLDGRTLMLAVQLHRDSPSAPLTARFTVIARDGKAFPAGVRIERAWVLEGWELWRVPAIETSSLAHRPQEVYAIARGGPRWPAAKALAVLRLVDRDGRKVLLSAHREITINVD